MLLAFLVLALACYTSVAAARAMLFAGLPPRDLIRAFAAATRYHYLAQVSIAVIASLVLAEVGRRLQWSWTTNGLILGVWAVWALVGGALLSSPSDHFADFADRFARYRTLLAEIRERMVQEVREHPPGSTVCLRNQPMSLSAGFPGSVGVFVLFYPDDEIEGRRVYFVSSDPELLARREEGGRVARLLLPASACPP